MEIIIAIVLGFIIAAASGRKLVPFLRKLKAGQSIKEDGPSWHMTKQGTPTMGGLIFILGIAVSVLVAGWKEMLQGNFTHLYILLFAMVFGLIGFVDDYQKVVKHQNEGLTAIQKFALQLVAAVIFLFIMKTTGIVNPDVYVPFFQISFTLPWPLYFAFAAFVIVGTVNAVNITDGIDGLASSVTLPVAVFFALCGALWTGFKAQSIFAGAMLGALVGFLIYNFHPAKVFMGDTGSLFLGGAIAALAFSFDMPLILVLVGFVYFCETMSDIIQVAYFKVTHGKRIFKMAPIHHHFEMCGWNEVKIVCIFTAVSTIFCALATLGILNRP